MPMADHATDTLELIELSKQWKFANDPAEIRLPLYLR